MKITKRIAVILISLIMCLSTVSYAEFNSYLGYNETTTVDVTSIVFKDKDTDTEITSLIPGKTVKAICNIKKADDRFQRASLVLSLFSGNKAIKTTTQNIDLSSGGEFELANEILIPNEKNLSLQAYIWDGINNSAPLAKKAVFGSDNVSIEKILIDGEELKDFSNDVCEYTVRLDSSYSTYPVVTVKTSDLSAKAEIKELYSFSSSVKQIYINVTSQNGENSKGVTLTFDYEEPSVSNVNLNINGSSKNLETDILKEPVWEDGKTPEVSPVNGGTVGFVEPNLPKTFTKQYSDANSYYMTIKPEFEGATVISLPEELHLQSDAVSSSNSRLLSFDINHTADIYIDTKSFSGFTQLTALGFEKKTEYLAYRLEPESSSYKYLSNSYYFKTYPVEKNKTVTVELPYTNSGVTYTVFVKFKDEQSKISNAAYTKADGTITSVATTHIYEPKAYFGTPANINRCVYKSKVFSDNSQHTVMNLLPGTQGSEALVLPLYTGAQDIKKISFTLNKTAAVYFVWRDTDSASTVDKIICLGDEGYTRYSASTQMSILNTSGKYNFPHKGGIFKKEYYLKPGETKEIVFDGIPRSEESNCLIFVTDINYDYYDTDNSINITSGNSFVFEAEDQRGQVNHPFTRADKFGESTVWVDNSGSPNITDNGSVYLDSSALVYPITVEENENYYIWVRLYSKDNGADSFFVSFDDEEPQWITPEYKEEWQWMLIRTQFLKRGKHTMKFFYRELNIAFDKISVTSESSFTPDGFTWQTDSYSPGNITPPANTHPRLFINEGKIPVIKENLSHEQNSQVYQLLLEDAGYNTNGYLSNEESLTGTNADTNTLSAAMGCAFLYVINKNTEAGEKAVRIFRNLINTVTTKGNNFTYISRNTGHTLFTCALVYDWCYDLLSETDKQEFIGLFYILASQFECGWPPVKQSNVTGHGLEGEILKDFLSVGIAVYDEEPNIYNNVAGRIINEIVPVKNHYSQSMQLFDGVSYGPYREFFTLLCAYMFDAIGYSDIFNSIKGQLYGTFYNRKPDGRYVSTGDDATERYWGFSDIFNSALFLAGNFYKDPYLKREYFRGSDGGITNENDCGTVSTLIHLITNDTTVPVDKSFRDLPLTAFYNYPSGIMSARTGWDEGKNSDVLHVQMNIQQQYFGGHQHLDSGHFDIYYKGTLALDSGLYESASWVDENGNTVTNLAHGSVHDHAYHKRTIAHNSLLIYDPDEIPVNSYFNVLDGGQTGKFVANTVNDASKLIDGTVDTGYVISYDFGEDLYAPEYSYLKGNLTEAYGSKAKDYTRTFMFLNFKDEDYPGALIVYDNVIDSSALKKTWLLHSQEEPVINNNRTTITATTMPGNNGRLINDTLLPKNPIISKVGGKGEEFTVNGVQYNAVPKSSYTESGVWRVEISPALSENNTYNSNEEFLNIMQMSENKDEILPLETELITSVADYNGVKIKDRIVYLKKTEQLTTDNIALAATDGRFMQIIDGLEKGLWQVKDASGKVISEKDVFEGHNTLSFEAQAGSYTLVRISSENKTSKDYSLMSRVMADDELPIDIKIGDSYETFANEPYVKNGNLYLNAEELAKKLNKSYSYKQNVLKIGGKTIPSSYTEIQNGVVYVSPVKSAEYINISAVWIAHSRILLIK